MGLDDSPEYIAFAVVLYLFIAVLTATASVYYPSIQQFSGVTPPSQIQTCQSQPTQGFPVAAFGIDGEQWPSGAFGGLIGAYSANNVGVAQNSLVLKSGSTSGFYEISEFAAASFPFEITQIEYDASIPTDADIQYLIASDSGARSFDMQSGTYNVTFQNPLQTDPRNDNFPGFRVNMSRDNTNVTRPVLNWTRIYADTGAERQSLIRQGRCAVDTAVSLGQATTINTGNIYIDTFFDALAFIVVLITGYIIIRLLSDIIGVAQGFIPFTG